MDTMGTISTLPLRAKIVQAAYCLSESFPDHLLFAHFRQNGGTLVRLIYYPSIIHEDVRNRRIL